MAESEIDATAEKIVHECMLNPDWDALCKAIAEALLSERRQCADIAYNAALYSGCPADFIAEEIAETVRQPRNASYKISTVTLITICLSPIPRYDRQRGLCLIRETV